MAVSEPEGKTWKLRDVMDNAPNYGNTDGTVGHELTHAFDDEGIKLLAVFLPPPARHRGRHSPKRIVDPG